MENITENFKISSKETLIICFTEQQTTQLIIYRVASLFNIYLRRLIASNFHIHQRNLIKVLKKNWFVNLGIQGKGNLR